MKFVVVAGFARSGTSLMMNMLQKGGIPVHCDFPNDVAHGFESSDIERLPHDPSWLTNCDRKAFKLIEPLRHRLPDGHEYCFIWMNRNPMDMAVSSSHFMRYMQLADMSKAQVKKLANSFRADKPKNLKLLQGYSHSSLLIINFSELMLAPLVQSAKVSEFLKEFNLDYEAMAKCVRKRSPEPSPYSVDLEDALMRPTIIRPRFKLQ